MRNVNDVRDVHNPGRALAADEGIGNNSWRLIIDRQRYSFEYVEGGPVGGGEIHRRDSARGQRAEELFR